jgi:hypothetical protein
LLQTDSQEDGLIISSVDSKPTPNLDTFIDIVRCIPDRSRVPISYYSIMDVHTVEMAVINIDRYWNSFKLWVRNGNILK